MDLALERPVRRRRLGAGRPRKVENRSPHVRRPELADGTPVHVSLRVSPAVGRLRNRIGYQSVRRAIAAIIGRRDFRIVHVSIQGNHIHLVTEADDKRALANGVRAFMISAAQHLNRRRGRRGNVFATRYHAVQLRTPLQVRNGLGYVLNNWRRHREDVGGPAQRRAHVDPYSSGILFDGWRDAPARFFVPEGYEPLPVAGARSWLLTTGWRLHHPLIGLREVPGPRPSSHH